MTKHTPTPWMIIKELGNTAICTSPDDEHAIINCWPNDAPTTGDVAIANAKFIVRACNAHAALVDALVKSQQALYVAANEEKNELAKSAMWNRIVENARALKAAGIDVRADGLANLEALKLAGAV